MLIVYKMLTAKAGYAQMNNAKGNKSVKVETILTTIMGRSSHELNVARSYQCRLRLTPFAAIATLVLTIAATCCFNFHNQNYAIHSATSTRGRLLNDSLVLFIYEWKRSPSQNSQHRRVLCLFAQHYCSVS